MKESARIALSYVRWHADELGIDEERVRRAHVPRARAGGRDPEGRAERRRRDDDRTRVAADGPRRQAHGRHDRRGHTPGPRPPIGGLKQKVLAAHAAGLREVILPERNRADLDDVPEDVRDEMTFHPVMTLGEALGSRSSRPRWRRRMRALHAARPVPEEVRRAADLLERRWLLLGALGGRLRRRAVQRVPAGARRVPPRTLALRLRGARGGRRPRAARSTTRARRGSSTG